MKKFLFALLVAFGLHSPAADIKLGAIPETNSVAEADRLLTVPQGANSLARLISTAQLRSSLLAGSHTYTGTFVGSGAGLTGLLPAEVALGTWGGITNGASSAVLAVLPGNRIQVGTFSELDESLWHFQGSMGSNSFLANRYFLRATASVNNAGDAYGYGAFLGRMQAVGNGGYNLIEGVYGYAQSQDSAKVNTITGGRMVSFHDSSGTATNVVGLTIETGVRGSGVASNIYGIRIWGPNVAAPTSLTGTNFGLKIENQVYGSGQKYAIYTGTGSSYFGGDILSGTRVVVSEGTTTDASGISFANESFMFRSAVGRVKLTASSSFDVSSDIRPGVSGSFDLGAASLKWRQLFLSGAAYAFSLGVSNGVAAAGNVTASNVVASATGGTTRAVDGSSQTNAYDDLQYSITTLNPAGLESAGTLVGNSGQSGSQLALELDDDNVIWMPIQLSHSWVPGTSIFPHLHVQPQTAAAINMVWRIAYSVSDVNGTFPADTVATNAYTIAAGNQWKHMLVNLPTNGISMSGVVGPSAAVRMKITLLSTDVPVHVIFADAHVRTGGSPTPYNP